jgi:hypothetical protein
MMTRFFLVFTLLLTSNAWGKRFANQFCEFELPQGWVCALEGSEWVCQSETEERKKEAIIILAAKVRGEQDSLDEYKAYLTKGKSYQLPGGKVQVSEAKYTKMTDVNGQQWIDALHLASEVPGFYTRYLATVKEDLGVAVTFSVSKDLYSTYQGLFDKVVSTLRVFRQQKTDIADVKVGDGSGEANLADATFIPDSDKVDISVKKTQARGSSEGDDTMLYAAAGGILLVVAFLLKKKKK